MKRILFLLFVFICVSCSSQKIYNSKKIVLEQKCFIEFLKYEHPDNTFINNIITNYDKRGLRDFKLQHKNKMIDCTMGKYPLQSVQTYLITVYNPKFSKNGFKNKIRKKFKVKKFYEYDNSLYIISGKYLARFDFNKHVCKIYLMPKKEVLKNVKEYDIY